jgi:hypothetical protein
MFLWMTEQVMTLDGTMFYHTSDANIRQLSEVRTAKAEKGTKGTKQRKKLGNV